MTKPKILPPAQQVLRYMLEVDAALNRIKEAIDHIRLGVHTLQTNPKNTSVASVYFEKGMAMMEGGLGLNSRRIRETIRKALKVQR